MMCDIASSQGNEAVNVISRDSVPGEIRFGTRDETRKEEGEGGELKVKSVALRRTSLLLLLLLLPFAREIKKSETPANTKRLL